MISSQTPRACIGICTFRSPEGVLATLDALATHETGHPFRVIVLDNDVNETARTAVEAYRAPFELDYRVEPRQGIPFARNALIAAAMEAPFDYLVMIDDDEQPLPGWLDRMIETAERSGAAIVGGGVTARFESGPDLPVVESDFQKLEPAILGGKAAIDSTANILFSRAFLDSWTERLFDQRFQFSGGSDSELLRRVSAAGHAHAFAEGAMVIENIPASRAQEAWLLKRNFRNGNVLGRVTVLHKGMVRALIEVAPRAVMLWLRGALRRLRAGQDVRRRFLARKDMMRARGMLAALKGEVMQEYADPAYRGT